MMGARNFGRLRARESAAIAVSVEASTNVLSPPRTRGVGQRTDGKADETSIPAYPPNAAIERERGAARRKRAPAPRVRRAAARPATPSRRRVPRAEVQPEAADVVLVGAGHRERLWKRADAAPGGAACYSVGA